MSNWNDLKEQVIDRELCCLCGTCIGVCPVHTLDFRDGAVRNAGAACVSCGRCMAACPGPGFDYGKYNEAIFDAEQKQTDSILGHYRTVWKGRTNDADIRQGASSGGIATALGVYLLEKGRVDYVIGVTGRTWKHSVRALRTRAEVLEAMQSKYVFVPVNSMIRYVLENEGRYMYVGLPCQVQGLRKAMDQDERLRERIALAAGIFCGFNMTGQATELLVRKSKIPREDIESIEYRGHRGEQTGFLVRSAQKEFFLPKHSYTLLNAFYSRPRCWKCYDLTAEFSDISLGGRMGDGCGLVTGPLPHARQRAAHRGNGQRGGHRGPALRARGGLPV